MTWIFPSVLYKKSRKDEKVCSALTSSSFLPPNCNTFFQYDKENRRKEERKARLAINNTLINKESFFATFSLWKTHTHLSLICINKLNEPC